jgi:hypothetical protein
MNWPAKRTIPGPICWILLKRLGKQERLNLLFEDSMPREKWGGENVFTPVIDIKEE